MIFQGLSPFDISDRWDVMTHLKTFLMHLIIFTALLPADGLAQNLSSQEKRIISRAAVHFQAGQMSAAKKIITSSLENLKKRPSLVNASPYFYLTIAEWNLALDSSPKSSVSLYKKVFDFAAQFHGPEAGYSRKRVENQLAPKLTGETKALLGKELKFQFELAGTEKAAAQRTLAFDIIDQLELLKTGKDLNVRVGSIGKRMKVLANKLTPEDKSQVFQKIVETALHLQPDNTSQAVDSILTLSEHLNPGPGQKETFLAERFFNFLLKGKTREAGRIVNACHQLAKTQTYLKQKCRLYSLQIAAVSLNRSKIKRELIGLNIPRSIPQSKKQMRIRAGLVSGVAYAYSMMGEVEQAGKTLDQFARHTSIAKSPLNIIREWMRLHSISATEEKSFEEIKNAAIEKIRSFGPGNLSLMGIVNSINARKLRYQGRIDDAEVSIAVAVKQIEAKSPFLGINKFDGFLECFMIYSLGGQPAKAGSCLAKAEELIVGMDDLSLSYKKIVNGFRQIVKAKNKAETSETIKKLRQATNGDHLYLRLANDFAKQLRK